MSTLEAFLSLWGVRLRIFTQFYEVFVNNCPFFMKINENTRKIKQIAFRIMIFAQKHRKSRYKWAKMRQGMPKMAQPASKVSPDGTKWAHLESLLPTLEALLATWGVPLCFFLKIQQA